MSIFGKIFSSLKETSEHRISNPIYGAFIFSWIAFNWKAIVIFIFSERGIYLKIDDIVAVTDIKSLLINPAIMTLVVLTIIPALNAIYALFDVFIKALHKISDVCETYFNSWFALREERFSAKISIEKELTIAKERAAIAEEKLREEQLNLKASLTRNNVENIKMLENNFSVIANNLNVATSENSNLIEENENLKRRVNELTELTQAIETISSELEEEKKQHEKTKHEKASVISQNRTLHIENSDLRSGLSSTKSF